MVSVPLPAYSLHTKKPRAYKQVLQTPPVEHHPQQIAGAQPVSKPDSSIPYTNSACVSSTPTSAWAGLCELTVAALLSGWVSSPSELFASSKFFT